MDITSNCKAAIRMLRQINLIVVNHLAPAPPPLAVAPAVPTPGAVKFVDPIDPDHGRVPREPREPRDDKRDDRRDEEDARVATATLILNRKIQIHQRKMRRLYLVEATIEKVKTMPLEQVKLNIQNAKTMYESYGLRWKIVRELIRSNMI